MKLQTKLSLATLLLLCSAACSKPPAPAPTDAATSPATSAPTDAPPTTTPPPAGPTGKSGPTDEADTSGGLPPGILFGPRRGGPPDGCFVSIFPDPKAPIAPAIDLRPTKVSCTAPIEPPPPGDTWCRVALADDPSQKIRVKCEP
jgi:hypothetical protein